MPAIDVEKPPSEALRALARKAASAISAELARARQGSGVHGTRKRLKFMRSLLRLIRSGLGEEAYRTADAGLRRAADAFAAARRREAMQEATAKLGATAKELAAIAGETHRDAAEPKVIAAAIDAAQAEIEALRSDIRRWRLPRNDCGSYARDASEAYRRARRGLRCGLAEADVDRLHSARRSVIHHLHHLEILGRLWPDMMRVWSGELERLREALGDLNDLEELEKIATAPEAAFSSDESRKTALAAIEARRSALLATIASLARHLFAEKPGAFRRRIEAMWRSRLS